MYKPNFVTQRASGLPFSPFVRPAARTARPSSLRCEAKGKAPMTKGDAARIHSATAKDGDGTVSKDSFASRAQSAADKAAAGSNDTTGPSKSDDSGSSKSSR